MTYDDKDSSLNFLIYFYSLFVTFNQINIYISLKEARIKKVDANKMLDLRNLKFLTNRKHESI